MNPLRHSREAGAAGAAATGVSAAALAGASAACCSGSLLAPLLVAALGAGGAAWAAGLKPYTPYLFALSGVLLAFAFRTAYRRPAACGRAAHTRWTRLLRRSTLVLLWLSAALWVGSLALAVYATWFDNPLT